jgi:hypothetical protein
LDKFIHNGYITLLRCLVNTDSTNTEAGRNRERQPPEQNPCEEQALLRFPDNSPGAGFTTREETIISVRSGTPPCFYLSYRPRIAGEPFLHPFRDRYEAATFIIGKAGRNLEGATDAERKRIRNYFPDIFGEE